MIHWVDYTQEGRLWKDKNIKSGPDLNVKETNILLDEKVKVKEEKKDDCGGDCCCCCCVCDTSDFQRQLENNRMETRMSMQDQF